MKKNVQNILFFLSLFIVVFLSFQVETYKNLNVKKNKFHHYFNEIKDVKSGKGYSEKQLIEDSLSQINHNSAQIAFVEVSQFTDSLSVRWITKRANSYNNFVQLNSGKSKHIGTTYISVSPNYGFVNADLKKVISAIKYDLVGNSSSKTEDVLGDYLTKNIKTCKLFYINGGENTNAILSYSGKLKYQFNNKYTDNKSLYVAQHLIDNYSFTKFQQLWRGGFSRFKKVYNRSFKDIELEREKLVIEASKNRTNINWEEFNRCI